MRLTDYFSLIMRRIWIIVFTTIIFAGIAVVGWSILPKTYEATTSLRVIPYSSGEPQYAQIVYADRIMNTYEEIASSSPVIAEVKNQLGISAGRHITIKTSVIPDSELLSITVEDSDPALAQQIANTIADILIEERPIQDVRIIIIESAELPQAYSFKQTVLIGMLAVFVGLFAGVAFAFIAENLDPRLHTSQQIEEISELTIIGEIPKVNKNVEGYVKFSAYSDADAILRSRTNLLSLAQETSINTCLITSIQPGEGKTTIIANLAQSIALSGKKVVLVDANLYKPELHHWFDLEDTEGFKNILVDDLSIDKNIQKTNYPGVDVITGGKSLSISADLLGTSRMNQMLQDLKNKYDMVLIDSPAILGAADGLVLASMVDAVLLVSKIREIQKPSLETGIQQLINTRANLIGIIINQVKSPKTQKYWRYYLPDSETPQNSNP